MNLVLDNFYPRLEDTIFLKFTVANMGQGGVIFIVFCILYVTVERSRYSIVLILLKNFVI